MGRSAGGVGRLYLIEVARSVGFLSVVRIEDDQAAKPADYALPAGSGGREMVKFEELRKRIIWQRMMQLQWGERCSCIVSSSGKAMNGFSRPYVS